MEEKIKISKAKYVELCKEACNNFEPTGDRKKDEEKLLFRVCGLVFGYLEEPLELIPAGDLIYTYYYNLQQLILNRQSEPYDSLHTPSKFILDTLNKAYETNIR